MDEEEWGKLNFDNEEIDLDNCDIEKLLEMKKNLELKKSELKKIIEK